MRPRQYPQAWLFTDPRLGPLVPVLARLPRGTGVVLRGAVDAAPLLAIARRRDLLLVDEGDPRIARAHDLAELVAARRSGAMLVFVSPVFATRTHPGQRPLGVVRFGLLVRGAGVPVAALGGMTARRFRRLRPLGATAWGAIDAWI